MLAIIQTERTFSLTRLTLKGQDDVVIVVDKLTGDADGIGDFLKAKLRNAKNVLAIGLNEVTPGDIQVVYVEGSLNNGVDTLKVQLPTRVTALDDGYASANFLATFENGVGVLSGTDAFARDPNAGVLGTKLVDALFVDGKLKGTDQNVLILIGSDELRRHVAFDLRTGVQAALPDAFETDVFTTNTVVGNVALIEASVDGNDQSPDYGTFKTVTAKTLRALLDNADGGTLAWTDVGNVGEQLTNLSTLSAAGGNAYVGLATYKNDDGISVAPITFTVEDDTVAFNLAADQAIRLDADTARFGQPVRVNTGNVIFVDAYGDDGKVTVLGRDGLDESTRTFFGTYQQLAAT